MVCRLSDCEVHGAKTKITKNSLKPNVTDNFQTTALVKVFCSTYKPYKCYHNVCVSTCVLVHDMTIETVLCDLFTF